MKSMFWTNEKLSLMVAWSSSVSISCFKVQLYWPIDLVFWSRKFNCFWREFQAFFVPNSLVTKFSSQNWFAVNIHPRILFSTVQILQILLSQFKLCKVPAFDAISDLLLSLWWSHQSTMSENDPKKHEKVTGHSKNPELLTLVSSSKSSSIYGIIFFILRTQQNQSWQVSSSACCGIGKFGWRGKRESSR